MSRARLRKQRFPRSERKRSGSFCTNLTNFDSDDGVDIGETFDFHQPPSKRYRPMEMSPPTSSFASKTAQRRPENSKDPSSQLPRLDKRARDEHNEQERNRRRELAVIYECIRLCFQPSDLGYLDQSTSPKSINKLSYPQVLQIAYSLMEEESHHLQMYYKLLRDIDVLEHETSNSSFPMPLRPKLPSIAEIRANLSDVIDQILRNDKLSRTKDGVYRLPPSSCAVDGHAQLMQVANAIIASMNDQERLPHIGAFAASANEQLEECCDTSPRRHHYSQQSLQPSILRKTSTASRSSVSSSLIVNPPPSSRQQPQYQQLTEVITSDDQSSAWSPPDSGNAVEGFWLNDPLLQDCGGYNDADNLSLYNDENYLDDDDRDFAASYNKYMIHRG